SDLGTHSDSHEARSKFPGVGTNLPSGGGSGGKPHSDSKPFSPGTPGERGWGEGALSPLTPTPLPRVQGRGAYAKLSEKWAGQRERFQTRPMSPRILSRRGPL